MRLHKEQEVNARFTTLLVAGFIFLVYLLFQGEQGEVLHISRDEQSLYFSMGEYGSFQIYEFRRMRPQPQPGLVTQPGDPQRKVHVYTSPLEKSRRLLSQPSSETRLKRGDVSFTVARGNILYVVDPNRGLLLYDITLRRIPVEIGRFEFYDIHDLVFFEQIAFVAAGKAGVYILDLAQPQGIQVLGHYDTAGSAEAVHPVFVNFGEMSIQTDAGADQVQEQVLQQYLVFVADGDAGYVILDFKTGQAVFREMTLLRAENTPGYASDVFFRDSYLFLADGVGGVRIFDLFSVGFDPANPNFLGIFDTPGTAYQIAIQRSELYIADGEAGLVIADLDGLFDTRALTALGTLVVPAEVTSLVVSKDMAVLGGGEQGVFLVDISSPTRPILIDSLHTPGISSISQILGAIWNRSLRSEKVTASLYEMGREILFASGIFLILIMILIPYIIPETSLSSALRSVNLFGRFLLGRAGRAVLVEAGEMKTDPLIQDQSTTQTVILDNSSAGLVRDSQGMLRLAAPGTSRLRPGEALVEMIDLRPRTFIFGPADEDPFDPRQENEDEIMARHRARRRVETQAFTQDAAEIVPNIIIDFRVKSIENSPSVPFGYHPGYVFQALRQEYATDKTFVESHHLSSNLNRLPGELAIKAWREVLQCFTLEDLFSPLDGLGGLAGQRNSSGFQFVVGYVNRLLQQQYVDEVGLHGEFTGKRVFSEAFNELEQAGLQVLKVWIINPRLAPESGEEFVNRYFNTWEMNIQGYQTQVKAKYEEIEAENRQLALIDFARASIHALAEGLQRYQSLPANFLFLNRSLYLLLRGTSTLSRISAEQRLQLNQILAWLESNLET